MLTIKYQGSGEAFSDFTVDNYLRELLRGSNIKEEDVTIITSTENLIYAVRKLVLRGNIPHDEVLIVMDEGSITLDESGSISTHSPNRYGSSYIEDALNLFILHKFKPTAPPIVSEAPSSNSKTCPHCSVVFPMEYENSFAFDDHDEFALHLGTCKERVRK